MKDKKLNYKVVVSDWVNGILTKFQKFFPSFEEAKKFVEQEERESKIYDEKEKILHSEVKKEKKPKKEKKDKKDKKDDDDDYN